MCYVKATHLILKTLNSSFGGVEVGGRKWTADNHSDTTLCIIVINDFKYSKGFSELKHFIIKIFREKHNKQPLYKQICNKFVTNAL